MTSNDRENDVPDLLAMNQSSVARMLAAANSLQEQGRLRPMLLPAHVSPPAVEPLRVKAKE